MTKYNFFFWVLAITLFASCKDAPTVVEDAATADTTKHGINVEFMDTTVAPSDDFFRYVNGKWLDANEIPADRSSWGSFNELQKTTSDNTLAVLQKAIAEKTYAEGTDQYKAALYYQVAMDTTKLNAAGVAPLKPYLDEIAAVKNVADLQALHAKNTPLGFGGLWGFSVFADSKNSSVNAAYVNSATLGLPERDYYMSEETESVELREKYQAHVARMFGFLGMDEATAAMKAANVLAFETKLAEPMLTKEASRDPYATYNKMSIPMLNKQVPAVDWKTYIKEVGGMAADSVIVGEMAYMDALNKLLKSEPIENIKDYLTWTYMDRLATRMSTEIDRANFDFFGKTLRGQQAQRDRKERTLQDVNGSIGEAVGKLYVDEFFPPEAKKAAEEMVQELLGAFGDRIAALDWMSDVTKQKAQEKMDAFNVKIGYPDKWKDYSKLEVTNDSYVQNAINVAKWNYAKRINKIGKEVDKTEWFMPPQMVNAYYNPLFNEIVFPAAILQPPFYDYKADAAVNFGGIGAVIGHEASHGFDDQGAQFDKEGNLNNWWTEEDKMAFEARNGKLKDQFDAYEALPGIFVNGEFTMGENIGDIGGINIAYDGLQRYLNKNGNPGLIDGFTPEQRLFISWGTIWRIKFREEALKNRIKTDPHSPGMFRAVGPISNMPEFYEAFNVKEGDKMYRAEDVRVKIW